MGLLRGVFFGAGPTASSVPGHNHVDLLERSRVFRLEEDAPHRSAAVDVADHLASSGTTVVNPHSCDGCSCSGEQGAMLAVGELDGPRQCGFARGFLARLAGEGFGQSQYNDFLRPRAIDWARELFFVAQDSLIARIKYGVAGGATPGVRSG